MTELRMRYLDEGFVEFVGSYNIWLRIKCSTLPTDLEVFAHKDGYSIFSSSPCEVHLGAEDADGWQVDPHLGSCWWRFGLDDEPGYPPWWWFGLNDEPRYPPISVQRFRVVSQKASTLREAVQAGTALRRH